jgi:uncharacterized membrane protein
MMGYGMMGGGWMGGGMWIFWIFIAVGAYFLFAGMPWYERGSRRASLIIAEERYAKGEITANELAEIRDNLESR